MIMNKWFYLLFFSFFSLLINAQEREQQSYILPYLDWSQEKFDWNIAGNENGQYPNILSELQWKDLRGPKMGIKSAISILSKFQLKLDLSYKIITAGKVSDTDYAGDNRFVKTSELNLQANKGSTIQTRIELSYLLWSNQEFSFSPHLGYYGSYQTLYMLDGDIPLIAGKELKSTYKPQWHGVIFGIETNFRNKRWDVSLDVSGTYLPHYSAKANWNLREELRQPISFEHKSKAVQWNTGLCIGYQFGKQIEPFISINYTQLTVGKGTDTLYKANGTFHKAQLNEAHANNISVGIGLKILLLATNNY